MTEHRFSWARFIPWAILREWPRLSPREQRESLLFYRALAVLGPHQEGYAEAVRRITSSQL